MKHQKFIKKIRDRMIKNYAQICTTEEVSSRPSASSLHFVYVDPETMPVVDYYPATKTCL